nr:hypothetical protein [Tanacetum cinerariifolium]
TTGAPPRGPPRKTDSRGPRGREVLGAVRERLLSAGGHALEVVFVAGVIVNLNRQRAPAGRVAGRDSRLVWLGADGGGKPNPVGVLADVGILPGLQVVDLRHAWLGFEAVVFAVLVAA